MKTKLFLLIILILFFNAAFAQWQPTNGPITNIEISSIVANDSLILASASGGSYISSNNGNSWNYLNSSSFRSAVEFKDNIYLASLNTSGIFKFYYDAGQWHEMLVNPDNTGDFYVDTETIYAATSNGFQFSSDGTSWQSYNDNLPMDSIYEWPGVWIYYYISVSVAGNSNYIFVGTKKGVYRSPKSSLNWVEVNNGLPRDFINSILCKDSIIIATSNNNLYKSTNNGDTWSLVKTFSENTWKTKLRNINDTLFLMTNWEGLFISYDLGDTWTTANNGLTHLSVSDIIYHHNIYFLANIDGVFKNLSNWSKCNQGINCWVISDLEKNDSCIIAVDYNNIFISKDEGQTWQNKTSTFPNSHIKSVAILNNSLFFSTVPHNTFPIDPYVYNYISYDNGENWSHISNLPSSDYTSYFVNNRGSNIIVASSSSENVYLSTDNGYTWTNNICPIPGIICNSFNDAVFNGDNLFLSPINGVIKSTNFGVNWVQVNNGLPNTYFEKLFECYGILFAGSQNMLYKSTDNGISWQSCGIPSGYPQDMICDNQHLFLSLSNHIYISYDFGESWINISNNLPSFTPSSSAGPLLIKDNLLFFGSPNAGVWKTQISDIGVSVKQSIEKQKLLVFPNPTTGKLKIETRLPEKQSLEVFDINGRQILKDQFTENTEIDLSMLDNGIYFISIKNSLGVINKKLVISK